MTTKKHVLRSFSPMFWLVIVFEFFERGSYYGVMAVLSVYLTDVLGFAKDDVGLIKGTIQPLLYFLPIISGALADRFGYRGTLLVAFSLLGGGYFLTAQMTSYAAVFLALCVMGLGAGAFKPVISGTIARVTDESNSTFGFGVYYWSINLGAFLFPLFLVPYLKNNIGWQWVLLAAAIGTGAMILPTLLLFREPEKAPSPDDKPPVDLSQTLANGFEVIYSPIVLILQSCRGRAGRTVVSSLAAIALVAIAAWQYLAPRQAMLAAPGVSHAIAGTLLEVRVVRNTMTADAFTVSAREASRPTVSLVVHRPDEINELAPELLQELRAAGVPASLSEVALQEMVADAVRPPRLHLVEDPLLSGPTEYVVSAIDGDGVVLITVRDPGRYQRYRQRLVAAVQQIPELRLLPEPVLDGLFQRGSKRPFLLSFVALLVLVAAAALGLNRRYQDAGTAGRLGLILVTVALVCGLLWLLPDLSVFARIVSTVIALTVLSVFLMDLEDVSRFRDHARFLLLIFLYSGFWVLYFQMFDSVLWYVQAYVDASSLNHVVNGALNAVGISIDWRFDIEHVTVVNAGTIILLQLLISSMVTKAKALPTMIVGIALGTIGMAILAISTDIWVFNIGIIIFSIGEMTAHPKLISYIGQIAPRDRVANYMGYIFLYGVIGSSIGAVVGARLYVQLVDNMNQPRLLWIIFSLIGVVTIIGLALYNRFLSPEQERPAG